MPLINPQAWRMLRELANGEPKNGYADRGFVAELALVLTPVRDRPDAAGQSARSILDRARNYAAASAAERPALFWDMVAGLKQLEMDLLAQPVQFMRGVGPARAKLLDKKDVATVNDLLHFYPRAYLDRRRLTPLGQLRRDGEAVTVAGRITTAAFVAGRRGRRRLEAMLEDETGYVRLTWFNARQYLKDLLQPQSRWLVSGTLQQYQGWQLINPEMEPLDDDEAAAGAVKPVYPETQGLTSRTLRQLTQAALDEYGPLISDPLPRRVLQAAAAEQPLPALGEALRDIHFPETPAAADRARLRLKFQELFFMQLALLDRRAQRRALAGKEPLAAGREALAGLLAALPFALTAAQARVLDEIIADLRAPQRMYRLVQGDVGSGKTVLALAAAVLMAGEERQTAIMAPTELLAQQHYLKALPLLEPLGVRAVLLIGSLSTAEKKAAKQALASGAAAIAFGTHALIQEGVAFRRLGLAVIDEQHRFGVLQRAELTGKGTAVDQLVMTATPIPRTLALTVYGDMDCSVLDELPPGRRPIATALVTENARELATLWAEVRGRLAQGERAYIVFPLIEESEELDLRSATESYEAWRTGEFHEYACGLLHGRMATEDKERVMDDFRCGRLQVLFSTTVIEVGVDVPEATMMLVWDAQRFGVAQLHQLRGRVGRGRTASICRLLAPARLDPEKRAWLTEVARTTDGFRIAELDLKIRGQGDFLGTRQHGAPELQLADILTDTPLLVKARAAAESFLDRQRDPAAANDPLERALGRQVQRYLELRYGQRLALLRA
ncbi:MAG TPA: ATP-dependent DNA helicase RecG [bacterium]|nr:ATP-dependent DNA helicase RecG [bacterium]